MTQNEDKNTENAAEPEASELSDLLLSNVRYKISYGDREASFSAPMANSTEELGDILIEAAAMLKAKRKRVIGECDKCWAFLLENEEHACA